MLYTNRCTDELFCLPTGANEAVCRDRCNVAAGNPCPDGLECEPLEEGGADGVCVEPGSVPEGGDCGSSEPCEGDLMCIVSGDEPDRGTCRAPCNICGNLQNECVADLECYPMEGEQGVCLETISQAGLGQPCDEDGACGKGLICDEAAGRTCQPICMTYCPAVQCTQHIEGSQCVPLGAGAIVGVCQ